MLLLCICNLIYWKKFAIDHSGAVLLIHGCLNPCPPSPTPPSAAFIHSSTFFKQIGICYIYYIIQNISTPLAAKPPETKENPFNNIQLTLLAEDCCSSTDMLNIPSIERREWTGIGSVVWTRKQSCPEIACLESSHHSSVIENSDSCGPYFRRRGLIKGGKRGMKSK